MKVEGRQFLTTAYTVINEGKATKFTLGDLVAELQGKDHTEALIPFLTKANSEAPDDLAIIFSALDVAVCDATTTEEVEVLLRAVDEVSDMLEDTALFEERGPAASSGDAKNPTNV